MKHVEISPETTQELEEAADAYLRALPRLHNAILKAAAEGANGNQVALLIRHTYKPDYIRKIVREARAAGKIPPPEQGNTAAPGGENTGNASSG